MKICLMCLKQQDTIAAASERLSKGGIDLVLLDQHLPDGTGLELQETLNGFAIIFMTGADDTNTAVSAMKAGAYDFLVKDINSDYLQMLPVTIENALKRKQDDEELKRYREHLEKEVQKRTSELQEVNNQLNVEIADRIEINEKLRRSEAHFRSVTESASDAIVTINSHGQIILANYATQTMFGVQESELLGEQLSSIIPEKYRDGHSQALIRLQSGGSPRIIGNTVELCGLHQNGSEFPVELSLSRWQVRGEIYYTAIIRDITKRKQAARALEESEEKYRLLVENASEAISMLDENGNYLLMNNSAAQHLGGQPQDFIGKNIFDILPQEHAEKHLVSVRNIVDTKQGHVVETAVPLPDGIHWFHSSSQPVLDHAGNVSGVMSISQDITERKLVDNSLQVLATTFTSSYGNQFFVKVSQYLTKTLGVDYAFVGELNDQKDKIQVVGGFGKGEAIEPFEYDLAGAPCENVVGQTPCLYASNVQAEFPDDHLLVEMGIEGYLGCPLWDKTGRPLGLLVVLNSMPLINEKILMTVMQIFTDRVSAEIERKNAEASLRQLNQAMEQSPVSVVITDTDGIIHYVNPKFSDVTGYHAKEVLGQNPRLLKSGKHPTEFYVGMWKALTETGVWRGEFHNRKKNGDFYWELASIAGVKDRTGKTTHYVAVKEDITERKQRDEEHVRQERLAAVGQLAAGIAHDFNNVMAVITLYSDLLQSSPNLTEREINYLKIIYEQAHHAANLTHQILDFSRRSVREPRPLDLKVLLSEMLKFVERTIPERIQVQFTFARGDYTVNADPTQLQQVITNLTVNARDAMPQSGALYLTLSRLSICADDEFPCAGMSTGEWVKLTITDTGEGIDPDVLPHIFEPFFTTKEVGKGTGLGLAQVYGIVHQHEGCIEVESRLGNGTSFHVYLPALVQETAVSSTNVLTSIPRGNGETILLVEDNQILLDAMQSMLESLNYRVLIAMDGEAGLDTFREHADDIKLILSDVVMPKMGGFEMVQALQEYAPLPKVFLMTGFPRDMEVPEDLNMLISDLLTKPLNIDQIGQLFREAIPGN